ncbi:MAG: branched-chain amino acid ABC transporter permease [Candidatus Lokiarchaeota archaeon]
MFEQLIIQIILFGTIQACVYALLAIGFTLVYGVGGILNLAHGAFYMLAGYFLFWFYRIVGMPFAMLIALILITGVGAVIYLTLVKHLQDREIGIVLITFALGFFIQQFISVIGGTKNHTTATIIPGSTSLFGVVFETQDLIIIFASLIVVAAIAIFIKKSKLGKSIRAVAQDKEGAMLSGINANRVLLYTFMLSALLAGVAAVLYVPSAAIYTNMGWDMLVNAFAVVVLGGLGSIRGSVIAAFIIGYTQNLVINLISPSLSGVMFLANIEDNLKSFLPSVIMKYSIVMILS